MKKLLIFLLFIPLLFGSAILHSKNKSNTLERPKIVIGLVMDQMRWDYLYRYYDKYSNDGFKRLINNGTSCEKTHINYLPSYTAPGHATIYTGTTPAYHGIVSNDWIDLRSLKEMYCVQDDSVSTIGSGNYSQNDKVGKKSPKNLISTTIGDELKLHLNFRNKSFGISLKDRGAILPAGHTADGAFWLDTKTGDFVSSTFYYKELPSWLIKFNERRLADSMMNVVWNPLFPINEYVQSSNDNNNYEGTHKHEINPVFPHDLRPSLEKDLSRLPYTPYGNSIVRMLAEELIIQENLGKSDLTDFLAISFSATDYMGHLYGPNAIEIEDMYYRLDRDVAALLQFFDQQFGKDNYLVFLTADHGGAHNFQFLQDNKIPAGTINESNIEKELKVYLTQHGFNDSVILSITNYQVYFNDDFINSNQVNKSQLVKLTKEFLYKNPAMAYVIDITEIKDKTVPHHIQSILSDSYYPLRSGHIQMVLNPGYYSGYGMTTGTTHGGWHPYDTHIPLLFYGWSIPKGRKIYRQVYMTDIAPTLSSLLSIQEPNACVGKTIVELFD